MASMDNYQHMERMWSLNLRDVFKELKSTPRMGSLTVFISDQIIAAAKFLILQVKSDGDSSNQSLKQSGEISWEDQIQNIWLNLLEPNISKYGRRFLKNDEECGINMVLQVIHAKFKGNNHHLL